MLMLVLPMLLLPRWFAPIASEPHTQTCIYQTGTAAGGQQRERGSPSETEQRHSRDPSRRGESVQPGSLVALLAFWHLSRSWPSCVLSLSLSVSV